MTYKEIINRIRTVVEDHYILKDFGYGQLSDLKTQSQLGPEEQGVDYPYLFLLPQTHQRQGPVMNYTFNMIVMDMARGEEGDLYDNYITIQSQCQQYIDDVLANLYYYYKDQPEVQLTGISYVPFKEKYQDELAGMTATITIQVPTPLNECIAPFVHYEEIIWVYNNADNIVDGDIGQNHVYTFAGTYFNPNLDWQINHYIVPESGTYKMVLDMAITLVQPLPGEAMPPVPVIQQLTEGPDPLITADVMTGWPTVFVNDTQVYNIHGEWIIDATLNPGGYTWEFIWSANTPGEQSGVVEKYGSELKIYKLIG